MTRQFGLVRSSGQDEGHVVIEQLNSRFSIGARLLLISGAFVASSAVAIALVAANNLEDKSFSEKEARGADHLGRIWQALRSEPGEAGSLLASGERADDAFASADERDAFLAARDVNARMEAGAGYILAVGDGSNLTLDPDLDSFYAMDAIVVRLPAVLVNIEALEGELRASGADLQTAQLAVARDRLERASAAAVSSLEAAISNNKHGNLAPILEGKADDLRSAVESLLAASRTGDSARELTAARAAVDESWEAGQKGLVMLLKTRIDGIGFAMGVELAISLISLALACLMSLFIARGLTSRVQGLLSVIDELRRANAAVTVPYLSDTNETGRLAGAIDMMRRGILERDAARVHAEAERQALEIEQKRHEEEMLSAERASIAQSIGEGLAALATGDLTYRIREELPEAYRRLREDFNTSVDRLQQSVRSVSTSVVGVRSGAGEVGQAADNLSRRTEQQAAALEETAAALDQITATVRKSAESAARANQIVAAARSDAESSGAIVQNAVSAMGEIEKSSSQISQIISVIDEIAFQTNLLALNAGVEAARAGEAGRGFAVVASEVRALAQRSSDAAKEIKQLISASSDHVDSGVSLVGKTGVALREMIGRVSEINELVSEIAASAREQATALQEVNTAVNQMDQVTQQNAAMVEETTAASHALNQEALELTQLVAVFNTGAEPAAARRPAAPQRPRAKAPPVLEQQRRVAAFVAARPAASVATKPADDEWDEF